LRDSQKDRDLSARSDVYSVGCVLYEMIAGQPPHTGPSAQSILVRILTESPRPLTDVRHTVPPHAADTVAKAIEKLPADRFESARAFIEALEDESFTYSPAVPDRTAPISAPEPVAAAAKWPPTPWSRIVPWAVAAVFGLLAGAALVRPAPPQAVQRFPLSFDDLTLTGGPAVAISPDGSHLAYVGPETRIHWRAMSALESQVVSGSEGSRSPFFSPDGRSIGYWTGPANDDRIRTLSLDGSPPRTLGADHYPHAAWGDDGFIYYSDIEGDLYRVSEQGGDSEQLTDSTRQFAFAFPQPLPGSAALLVEVTDGDGARSAAILDLVSMDVDPLLDALYARYAGGHVFWVDAEGTLFAAPFDPGARELQAGGVEIAENVRPTQVATSYDFAVSDNGALIYVGGPSVAGTGETIAWIERDGQATPVDPSLTSEFADIDNLALSPDGRYVALEVAGEEASTLSQIWIYDVEQGVPQRLTFEGTRNWQPRWMPDGMTVAYLSDQTDPGGPVRSIRGQSFDRSGVDRPLIELDGPIDAFDVPPAPDLPLVVEASGNLYTAQVGDTVAEPFLVRDFYEWRARISPDGRWVAYQSDESGEDEVYVRAFPGGGRPWTISRGGGRAPVWGTAGDEIFYLAGPPPRVTVSELAIGEEVRVVSTTALFSATGLDLSASTRASASYAPSLDGPRLLVIDRGIGGGVVQGDAAQVILVLNIFDELRERMGG
jgi:Tol biopolymer transport system component